MSARAPEIVINGRFLMQPVTGVQRVARELVRALDHLIDAEARPVRLRLVCEPGADLADLDLRVTTVERAGGASGHLWEQCVLPRRVRGGHLLCLGNTAPLVALYAAHPTTVMIHDLSYRQFPKAYRRHYRLGHRLMLPFLLRRAHTILTVSETEKAVLGSLRPAALKRIRVTPNGGWRDGAVEARNADVGTGYVLYVGSLSQRKNIHGVLAVAVRLAREDGIATVLVGGTSDILSPIASAIPEDVRHLVRFAGPVTDLLELAELYRNAGCLLFPSLYEASPLPPIEAMSFGCPVVVSAIPAMTERCAAAAIYCDPDDIDDMVTAVRRAIRDRAGIAEQIERAYRHARRMSWRDQAEAVLAALAGQPVARGTLPCEVAQTVREPELAVLH
ncbi:MAG: hypothetical protein B7Z39_00685 [Novosphingobium sp. 12-64-8]|nr:MAG: hypothetical protein B7Z39_00685 [Novosphingobium sp. 12-64-8]